MWMFEQITIRGNASDGTTNSAHMGIPVWLPKRNRPDVERGGLCTALVVGVPIENLVNSLSLGANTSLIVTHIIREDGSYVVNSLGDFITVDNCFDWVTLNAEQSSMENIEQVVEAMKTAYRREAHTVMLCLSTMRCGISSFRRFRTRIWMMLTVMPHGVLDRSDGRAGHQRI